MASINWDEATPSDSESAGQGDDRIRSLKTSLRQGLATEHTWPSAGGEAGVHLLGSARVYFGPQSAVSSAGTDGRLQVASDTSRLFGVGSAGTVMLGAGPYGLSVGSMLGITFPQRHYLAAEMGDGVTDASGVTTITIPNSGYSGVPFVWSATSNQRVVYIDSKTPTTFQVHTDSIAGSGLVAPFTWFSVGSRVF